MVDFGSMKRPLANLNIHTETVSRLLYLFALEKLQWHKESCCREVLLIPVSVSSVSPNFLWPQERWWKGAVFKLHPFSLQAEVETHVRGREPLLQSALLPSARGRDVWSGRADSLLPMIVSAAELSAGENQWAASPNRPGAQRTAGNRYHSSFLHLTLHLAAACW